MQYNDNQGIQGGNYQLEKDNNASPPVANPNQQMYYAQPGQPQIVYQQPVYQQQIYQLINQIKVVENGFKLCKKIIFEGIYFSETS